MNGNIQKSAITSEEALDHQERTAKLRFRRSLIGGLSGPIIFGLVVAASGPLMTAAASELAALSFFSLPVLGVAVAAILAVGCLYINSRLDSQITRFEHEYQAKQISKGINSVEVSPEPKLQPFSSQAPSAALDKEKPAVGAPVVKVNEREWQDRVVPLSTAMARN